MKSSRCVLFMSVLFMVCLAMAQPSRSHYDPAPARRAGSQKGFVEWVFSRINPQDIDYGARIEEMRQDALDATVRDDSFWTDALAIGVFGMTFGLYYWQHRQNQRIRFSTTRIITGYHNELAVARDRLANLSAEYARIKAAPDDPFEAGLVSRPPASKRETASSGNSNSKDAASGTSNEPSAVERQLREEKDNLSQQLARGNETIGSLRQQVATLTRRLEEEQLKNRKLRGE